MAGNQREKVLMAVVGVLLGVAVIYFGWQLVGGTGAQRAQRDRLAKDVDERQSKVDRFFLSAMRLPKYRERALPGDPERASLLYQNWLLEIAGKADFSKKRIEPGGIRNVEDLYSRLTFSVRGQASLEQLSRFLYEFHSAGYLHQVRGITIKPLEESRKMDLVITIEAISMPNAIATDSLPRVTNGQVVDTGESSYIDPIVGRALFTAYVPPKPPTPPQPPTSPQPPEPPKPVFDPSVHTYISGIVEVDGRSQAWIDIRTQGVQHRLYRGDKFSLGMLQCTVHRIEPRRVVVEAAGGYYAIDLGHPFTEAVAVEQ